MSLHLVLLTVAGALLTTVFVFTHCHFTTLFLQSGEIHNFHTVVFIILLTDIKQLQNRTIDALALLVLTSLCFY